MTPPRRFPAFATASRRAALLAMVLTAPCSALAGNSAAQGAAQATPTQTAQTQTTPTQTAQEQAQQRVTQELLSLSKPYTINQLYQDLEAGKVKGMVLDGQGNAQVTLDNPLRPRAVRVQPDAELLTRLRSAQVPTTITGQSTLLADLGGLLPLLLLGLLLYSVWRGGRQQANPAGTFGKSRANVIEEGQVKVTFADIAGCDEAKADLAEVVDFLRFPDKYHALGARIPQGTLLVGPPGSGKTLLARAVAGEAGVPFFSLSGSDFVEMFVGVGAARVRDLFDRARKAAPCIVFIDEIDAVGRKRGTGMQGNDEREQTLNQLLVEMDGFGKDGQAGGKDGSGKDIIILAATNRPDVLDAALLRPGRFDRQVTVDAPDKRGREQILAIHARKKPLDSGVDLGRVARQTPGMVGADLENLLNEAALGAARAGRSRITVQDIEQARDRVLMGPERRSLVIAEGDRRVTAYHEVGHALAAQLLPHADRVHKLTVVPRGRALGAAMYTPEDRMHHTKAALLDRIAVALSGHAAEEVVLGEVTTGAENDFQQATSLARRMVTEWGMSDLGQVALQGQEGPGRGYSEETADQIDAEVGRIVNGQYGRVTALLREHLHQLHRLTDALMEREVLDAQQFATVLAGGRLPPASTETLPETVAPTGQLRLENT